MTTCQQFNLRWNNHTNNILTVFNEQLANESLVDVTLSCEGHFLKVHKMVLSACSPYFQEMFRTALHQVPNAVIIMSGMKFNDVKLVIDFMYRGEIKVQETELDGLLAVAESLQVKGLSNVRNKYEKGDIETTQQQQQQQQQQQHQQQQQIRIVPPNSDATTIPLPATPMHLRRKRRRLSEEVTSEPRLKPTLVDTVPAESKSSSSEQAVLPTTNPFLPSSLNNSYQDDDLPATIKVEPPDIRDIDEEPPPAQGDWESPKLVMDINTEEQEQSQSSDARLGVGKRVVVGSVIVKRGRGRPRKNRDEPEFVYQPMVQQTKSYVRVKPGTVPIKKLTTGAPTPWIMRKRTSKIPRPPNAFMIFANEYRRKLAYDNPSESNKDISVRLGIMWKNLPPEVKETYYAQSRTADEEHKRKYPGYYYSPKEARLRKNLKHDLAVARRGPKGMEANYLVNVVMPDENDSLPSYLMLQSQTSSAATSLSKRLIMPNKQSLPIESIEPDSLSGTCVPEDFVTVKIEEDKSVKVLDEVAKNNSRVENTNTPDNENKSTSNNDKSVAAGKEDSCSSDNLPTSQLQEDESKNIKLDEDILGEKAQESDKEKNPESQ